MDTTTNTSHKVSNINTQKGIFKYQIYSLYLLTQSLDMVAGVDLDNGGRMRQCAPPSRPNFLHFRNVFRKIWPNKKSPPQPLGFCFSLGNTCAHMVNEGLVELIVAKINVFALLRVSTMSHLILSIPEIPIDHKQAFIRIALFPLDSLESSHLFETLLSERLFEISHITSMLDLRKKTIKGFRSNKSSVWFDSLLLSISR